MHSSWTYQCPPFIFADSKRCLFGGTGNSNFFRVFSFCDTADLGRFIMGWLHGCRLISEDTYAKRNAPKIRIQVKSIVLLISFSFEYFVLRVSPSVVKTSHWKLYGLSQNQSHEKSICFLLICTASWGWVHHTVRRASTKYRMFEWKWNQQTMCSNRPASMHSNNQ